MLNEQSRRRAMVPRCVWSASTQCRSSGEVAAVQAGRLRMFCESPEQSLFKATNSWQMNWDALLPACGSPPRSLHTSIYSFVFMVNE
jgi:hypothetical protein